MNFQSKDPAQVRDHNSKISFHINQANFAENCTAGHNLEWIRVAPNKVIVANSNHSWLLEDNSKFHFT